MRIAGMALVALSGAAIALGLWTIGGPEQARREQRDAQRLTDLRMMARHYRCLNEHSQVTGAATPLCPLSETPTDPLNGAAYTITQSDERLVQICAEFETTLSARGISDSFDPVTGCLTISLSDGG